MIDCPHQCGVKLIEDLEMKKKGRDNVYICPKCKCVFALCLVRSETKCFELRHKNEPRQPIKRAKVKRMVKKHGRKRGSMSESEDSE